MVKKIALNFLTITGVASIISFVMILLFTREAFCDVLVLDENASNVSTVIYGFSSIVISIISATLLYRTIRLQINANNDNSQKIIDERKRFISMLKMMQYSNFSHEINDVLHNIEFNTSSQKLKSIEAIVNYTTSNSCSCTTNDMTFIQIIHILSLIEDFIEIVNNETLDLDDFNLKDNIYIRKVKVLYNDCLRKTLTDFYLHNRDKECASRIHEYIDRINKSI